MRFLKKIYSINISLFFLRILENYEIGKYNFEKAELIILRDLLQIFSMLFSILSSLLHADTDNSINAGCRALPEYQEESYQISWDR